MTRPTLPILIRQALPTVLWLGPLFVGVVLFALVATP